MRQSFITSSIMPTRTTYKPKPGSVPSQVVELLNFLPEGKAPRTSDLCKSLGIKGTSSFSRHLLAAVQHGLVRPVTTKKPGGVRNRHIHWIKGDGVPPAEPVLRAPSKHRQPAPQMPAVRSVFELGQISAT